MGAFCGELRTVSQLALASAKATEAGWASWKAWTLKGALPVGGVWA